MSSYAIGDIQGCLGELEALLTAIKFSPTSDRLYLLGDLVNRGPDSLGVLRLAKSLGDQCHVVLGNHDLSILAKYYSGKTKGVAGELARCKDGEELASWLRHQPLALAVKDLLLIHAGLPPQWTTLDALNAAREVEAVLARDDFRRFFDEMYGDDPSHWDEKLTGAHRYRFITNALTRLRYCHLDGSLALDCKLGPEASGTNQQPWFAMPRASADTEILFGHWSTLGQIHWPQYKVWGLDSGCVWGGHLTALRLEDRCLFQVASKGYKKPGKD